MKLRKKKLDLVVSLEDLSQELRALHSPVNFSGREEKRRRQDLQGMLDKMVQTSGCNLMLNEWTVILFVV